MIHIEKQISAFSFLNTISNKVAMTNEMQYLKKSIENPHCQQWLYLTEKHS